MFDFYVMDKHVLCTYPFAITCPATHRLDCHRIVVVGDRAVSDGHVNATGINAIRVQGEERNVLEKYVHYLVGNGSLLAHESILSLCVHVDIDVLYQKTI